MIVFVTGGSGCGKSAFAEQVAVRLAGQEIPDAESASLFYVATMPVFSEEDQRKVERHHRLRQGKGFLTLERPKKLEDLPSEGQTVLIECISTHTANMMFDPELKKELSEGAQAGSTADQDSAGFWTDVICRELEEVVTRKGHTVFVSAEVGMDGSCYDPETERYKKTLTGVNRFLMERSDEAYEVVCGIPVRIKGENSCLKA